VQNGGCIDNVRNILLLLLNDSMVRGLSIVSFIQI
jgi:hypothetical protein